MIIITNKDVYMDKGQLRQEIQNTLRQIPMELRNEKSKKACENLVSTQQFKDASVIMMYLAVPHETDCTEAILHAWQQEKTVLVPKVSWEHKHMIPVEIHSMETDFSMEISGLRNPVNGVPMPFNEIDLIVTPGLAFDKKGNRLGRGGAYYDRFFEDEDVNAVRCGFGFAEQFIDSVPTESHDQMMDFMVTDDAVVSFDNKQGE